MTLPGPYYHIICQVKLTLPEASCEVGSLKYRVLRGVLGAGFLFQPPPHQYGSVAIS